MSTTVLLLFLRIGSAALVLAFFGASGWYLWQNVGVTRRMV